LKITRVIISNILINGEVIYSTSYTAEKSQQWDPHVWGPYPLGLYADSQASNIFSKVDDCASIISAALIFFDLLWNHSTILISLTVHCLLSYNLDFSNHNDCHENKKK
jgi:hypothetical protein